MVSEKRKSKQTKDDQESPPSPIKEESESEAEVYEMKSITKTISWSESEEQGSTSKVNKMHNLPNTFLSTSHGSI